MMENDHRKSETEVPTSKQGMNKMRRVFGKRFSEYIAFQRIILILVAVVGLARLGLSLEGVRVGTVKWFSMTVVVILGILYYGAAVYMRGFGAYKQLLPLVLIQNVLANSIAILGIVLTADGFPNVFGALEYSGPFYHAHPWAHILGHVIGGMGIFTLVGWGVASVVMLVTKKLVRRPAVA